MRILATLRLALRALRRNKLRTVLTMLGIIIGVGSVITAVSITTGARVQVEEKVASLGQNVVSVFSGSFTTGGEFRFRRFDKPIAVSVPEKLVEQRGRLVEMEIVQSAAISRMHGIEGNNDRDRIGRQVVPGQRLCRR